MFSWILPRRSDPLKATSAAATWRVAVGDPGSEATIALYTMSIKQPVRSQLFLFDVTSDHAATSRHVQAEEARSVDDAGKSERRIVTQSSAEQVLDTKPGNAGGAKASEPSRVSVRSPPVLRDGKSVLQRLNRITERAKAHAERTFNNVYSLLNSELLWYAFRKLQRDKAPGVDGVTVSQYEANLRDNLKDLETRLHQQSYRPRPSLRRDIPKGNGKTRPLGIAAVEDKIVQRAVVMVLERIYEVDFQDSSYGFRPGRSCHDALKSLDRHIARKKVSWVSDSDIRGFFDQPC